MLSTNQLDSKVTDLPSDTPPAKPPKKKWKIAVIALAAAVILVPVIGFCLFMVSLSGGLQGILLNAKSAPDPQSSSLVAKRATATSAINDAFIELDKITGLTSYATSTHDSCYKGQNNWKVKDGYAYRCTYRATNFYGFNGDFRQRMIDFEQQITASGWKSEDEDSPLRQIMTDYYDEYYGKPQQVHGEAGEAYLVSNLPTPSAGYDKDGKILEITYAEKATKDTFQVEFAQNITRATLFQGYDKKNFQDVGQLFKEITANNTYVFVVSVQKTYYQD